MSTDCECSSAALCHLLGHLQDVIDEPVSLPCCCVADVRAGSVVVTGRQDSMPAHISQQSRQCICGQVACCATCRPGAAVDSCSIAVLSIHFLQRRRDIAGGTDCVAKPEIRPATLLPSDRQTPAASGTAAADCVVAATAGQGVPGLLPLASCLPDCEWKCSVSSGCSASGLRRHARTPALSIDHTSQEPRPANRMKQKPELSMVCALLISIG